MLPKAPKFWQTRNRIARALLPFSALYLVCHNLKNILTRPYQSPLPVICVGGVVAGGSGKTPVLHALLKLLREENLCQNPVILMRGYGGKLKGPTLVDPARHDAGDVGDEAMLHALHAPTIVSANRESGARLAEAMDADLILMDDGLQNNTLKKTLSLLVLDRRQGLGNGYLLPAGPLREPLNDALNKCACVIQTNGKADLHLDKATFVTELKVVSTHDKNQSYFAFAGLGHPEKFKLTLDENGFNTSAFKAFADHHPYTGGDIERLKRNAGDGRLITTEKDFVRIPPAYRDGIEVLKIEQVFTYRSGLLDLLKNGLQA